MKGLAPTKGLDSGGEGDPLGPPPTPMPRAVICPFCGRVSGSVERCASCGGRFDPLSRQATQNAMGPWFVFDERSPTRPGCTFETIKQLVEKGVVKPESTVRSPTTRQFWMLAKRVPGLANLFGLCHSCQGEVEPTAYSCGACGAVFEADRDRQHLGLGPVRLLPGQAAPDRITATNHAAAATAQPMPQPKTTAAESVESVGTAPSESRQRVLERRLAEQTVRARLAAGIAAVAVIALVAVVWTNRETLVGQPGPAVGTAQPSLLNAEPTPITAITGGAPSPKPSVDASEPIASVATEEAVEAALDDEQTWDSVRSRVIGLVKANSAADLTAAIGALDAFIAAGPSEAEQADAEALRANVEGLLERVRLRELP